MGYNSPITIMQNQMKIELENGIYKAVQKTDIEVDKDELIKALRYDRAQYDKGYKDGCKKTAKEIIYKLKDIIVKYRGVGCGVHPLMFDLYELEKQYGVIGEEV